jgi:hypothetical protein
MSSAERPQNKTVPPNLKAFSQIPDVLTHLVPKQFNPTGEVFSGRDIMVLNKDLQFG